MTRRGGSEERSERTKFCRGESDGREFLLATLDLRSRFWEDRGLTRIDVFLPKDLSVVESAIELGGLDGAREDGGRELGVESSPLAF